MSGADARPTVSVVIPTYNRAGLLARALRSVAAQTVAPHEVLVIDDASTDDTEAVCAAAGGTVRYHRQANAGPSVARNRGVELARASWIAFLDSDDLWHPAKLERQLAAIARAPSARWSLTAAEMIGLDDDPLPGRSGLDRVLPVFGECGLSVPAFLDGYLARVGEDAWSGDLFDAFFCGNLALPSAAMVERAAFLEAGGFDPALRQSEDMEFFFRLSARWPMVFLDQSLTGYRVSQADSLAGSAHAARLIENGLTNLERGAALRPVLSDRARAARAATEARWLRKLAYTYVSDLRPADARTALGRLRRQHPERAGGLAALEVASRLPVPLLVAMGRLKRALRAR